MDDQIIRTGHEISVDPRERSIRRELPAGSEAISCAGFSWAMLIEMLANQINDELPEVRHKETMWIVRARKQGVHIDFYDDEDAFSRRIENENQIDGPQIHAGRLHWM